MKHKFKMISALIAASSLAFQAHAAVFGFNLAGSGLSGSIELTYAVNPNTGVLAGTSPNAVDPIGSYIVTGATGSFSDSNIGLNSTITGVVLSQPANPTPDNLLAPHSFGFFPIGGGIPTPGGTAPGFSYDDLFYPGGSPQVASDYPFHGGVIDIYGLIFTLADGNAVNLWSAGDFGGGATYGAGVTDGRSVLDYVESGVALTPVPEPGSWALMIVGLGLVGAATRRRSRLRPA
jgi:hypothetical protein